MKIYDLVKVTKSSESYLEKGIKPGCIGRIVEALIIKNCFTVAFDTNQDDEPYIFCEINLQDLSLIEDGWGTDEIILEELPKKNPKWWCKVESGYILNLLGEKKNKIPYDYNS